LEVLAAVDGSVVDGGDSSNSLVGVSWGSAGNDGGGGVGRVGGGDNWAPDNLLSVVLLSVVLLDWDSLGLVGVLLSIGTLNGLNNSGGSDLAVGGGQWANVLGGNWDLSVGNDWGLDTIGMTFSDVVGEVSSVSLAVDHGRVVAWCAVHQSVGAAGSDKSNKNGGGLHDDCRGVNRKVVQIVKLQMDEEI